MSGGMGGESGPPETPVIQTAMHGGFLQLIQKAENNSI